MFIKDLSYIKYVLVNFTIKHLKAKKNLQGTNIDKYCKWNDYRNQETSHNVRKSDFWFDTWKKIIILLN